MIHGFIEREVSRRRLLGGGLVLAAGTASVALVGCGDDDKSSSETPIGAGATPTASTEKPSKGGTLAVAQVGGDLVFNTGAPYVSYPQNRYFQESVTESLVRYDQSLEPELLMADRFEYNDDRSKLTIAIKPDLAFHNGAPVTPEDVFFGIDVIVNPKKHNVTGNFQLVNFAKFVTDMKKVDARTMEFTFDKPRVNMTDFFAQLKVTQASSYEKWMTGQDVQGTGPYKFKSWTPTQSFRLEPNPNYHYTAKDGGPYLDAIEGRSFADADSAGLAFESGDMDMIIALAISGTIAKRFRDKNETRLSPKTGLTYCGANVTNAQLKDKRVREALFLAIDRQRFQKEIGEGFDVLTVQPWPKTSPAFDPALEAAYYDPDKAKSLLKEAGFNQTQPLKLEYAGATYPTQAALLKENFESVGIKIDLTPSEANAFTAKFAARGLTDLWISGHSFSDMAPLTNFQQTFPYRIPNIGYYGEPGGTIGQEYVGIIKQLESLDPLGDPAKALYKQFNAIFLDDPWLFPFAPYDRIDLVGSKVRGVEYTIEPGAGTPNFAKIWKKA